MLARIRRRRRNKGTNPHERSMRVGEMDEQWQPFWLEPGDMEVRHSSIITTMGWRKPQGAYISRTAPRGRRSGHRYTLLLLFKEVLVSFPTSSPFSTALFVTHSYPQPCRPLLSFKLSLRAGRLPNPIAHLSQNKQTIQAPASGDSLPDTQFLLVGPPRPPRYARSPQRAALRTFPYFTARTFLLAATALRPLEWTCPRQ